MIKEEVTYGKWKVIRHDDQKIEVYSNGKLCEKSAPELRNIAKAIGFEYKDEWRTSQLGREVIKAIKNAADLQEEPTVESEDGAMTLLEKLQYMFIVETDDEVYYDAESCDDDVKTLFVDNIRAQNLPDEDKLLESKMYTGADDLVTYLEEDPDELALLQKIIAAAYCTYHGLDIANDEPEFYVDETHYYLSDAIDFNYETDIDIDLG